MRVEVTHSVDVVPGQRYEYDLFRFSDLSRPLLKEAVEHMRSVGKTSLEWLNIEGSGYEQVP
jgi:hypothetical protein